ncbi:hypothetical protein [Leifsonia sp. fls2-241-R2A-40a]|uniref:hypothetical protein n=1 Tax=Leifsonia sp. fls2-241-R2A-40a TaxID=3040290 RepID=UPI002550F8BB|nr:hypothetical protein [Leifsonia sp. fls2-241-R2A-40a]
MTLLLDPRIQRVWRTPQSLQFGVDRAVLVLDSVSAAEERMLAALAAGVTHDGLRLIASRAGAPPGAVEDLLALVAPVLRSAEPPLPLPTPLVVLDGAGATAASVARMLAEAGADVLSGLRWSDPAVERADAAVIVASYAVAPQRHVRWLRRDVPHLAVVLSDAGVTVGPFVHPGRGPCLRCLDLHRTDADAAWPAMATQLHSLPPPGDGTPTAVAAAARAATAVAEVLALPTGRRADTGPAPPVAVSWRLEQGGAEWVSRAWDPHPECGCLALPG